MEKLKCINEEYRAMLEDDAGMGKITPEREIRKRLLGLFGIGIYKLWIKNGEGARKSGNKHEKQKGTIHKR